MANIWENNGNSERLYFLGSKITVDGDCSHEIKRHLLLVGKVMTNVDSILKSRSYGSSIFNFLKNLHTVLHSGCTKTHFANRAFIPFSPHLPSPNHIYTLPKIPLLISSALRGNFLLVNQSKVYYTKEKI